MDLALGILYETAPYLPDSFYMQDKINATTAAIHGDVGSRVRVLNLTDICFPTSKRLKNSPEFLSYGGFIPDSGGEWIKNIVNLDDVAAVILVSTTRHNGERAEEYNINDQAIQTSAWIPASERQSGLKNPYRLPAKLLPSCLGPIPQIVQAAKLRQSVIPPEYVRSLFVCDMFFLGYKAVAHLAWQLRLLLKSFIVSLHIAP